MKLFSATSLIATSIAICVSGNVLKGQEVTYQPYIQPGDSGPFGPSDQMVIAWQTNESVPHPGAYSVSISKDGEDDELTPVPVKGRVVDNYLAADPVVFGSLVIPTAHGAHTDYYAVLSGLRSCLRMPGVS
jgi:hypothetical protein